MHDQNNITPSCGAVILNDRGEVVLVEHLQRANHATGVFGLPAGRIEKGETALEAIVREVSEETGLLIASESFQKLPTVYTATIEQKDAVRTFSFEVFATRISSGELVSSKETKPVWVAIGEVKGMNLLPNVLNAINEARVIMSV